MASNMGTVNVQLEAEQVQVLNIQPGDTLVLKSPSYLSREGKLNMAQQLKEATGCDKVLVLDEGMELITVRNEQVTVAGVSPDATVNVTYYKPVEQTP